MKIELYLVPNDNEGINLKEFLIKNNIKFHEIITDNLELLSNITQSRIIRKVSLLKITFSSSIHIITGYQEHSLNQLLEHIKKYNPKII